MATKKSSTSKTARVMNLLSKSREEAPVEQAVVPVEVQETPEQVAQPAPVAAEPAPAAAHSSVTTTPLISSMQADSAISNQVMSALENALDEELGAEVPAQAEPAPAAAPAAEPVAEVETAPPVEVAEAPAEVPVVEAALEPAVEAASEVAVSEPAAEVVPVAPAEPAPVVPAETAVQTSEPAAEPAPPTQFKVDSNTTYVNVMETLVEEKANKYIDLFGLCKCPRCVADVKAYALNHLNPKYVVMRTGEVIPRITVYENQFSAVVTAQILNACKIVMSSPRHDQQ